MINSLSIGQIVYSKCGRDKGHLFIVVELEGEYCFLADGDLRKLKTPKKKKLKHIQPTNNISELISKESLLKDLKDSDLRSVLLSFKCKEV
jgi:ribosomal protein L14E/L6E/L27E